MFNHCDLIIENVQLASMIDNGVAYGMIEQAAVAIRAGKIVFAGPFKDCDYQATERYDGQNQWLLPGFVDCHTHLVYAGSRAGEFEQRLKGISYEQIARQGGGIKSTVKATREATEQQLTDLAIKRAKRLIEEGVTCIEIKSGYGLDIETEAKMLNVAKGLQESLGIHVETTYLGAHALPPEYSDNAQGYIDFVCTQAMPYIAQHQLASCVDVFCEGIGFTPAQCEQVFETAQALGLRIKAHVEQLSNLHGAKLASHYGALSVDHIEYLTEQDVPALKNNHTVAVLLPGAYYYLNESQKPPVEALRKHQVPMAVATDLNPGTSPIASLLTSANMACVLFGLTPEEALRGITVNGARALGLHNKGCIAKGYDADLTLWEIDHPAQIVHELNGHRPVTRWVGGKHGN